MEEYYSDSTIQAFSLLWLLQKALRGMQKGIWGKKGGKLAAQGTIRHHLKAKGLRRTLVPQCTSPASLW